MRRLGFVWLREVVVIFCLGVLACACSSTAGKNSPAKDSGTAGSDSGAAGSDSGAANKADASDGAPSGSADAIAPADAHPTGCGSAGATPVAATCGKPAGACVTHAPSGGHSAVIVCTEFGGTWTLIPAQAAQQCGSPKTWHAGKTCAQAVSGIQAGCETKIQGGFCNVNWYGPGCLTALGSSCQAHPTHDTWVKP